MGAGPAPRPLRAIATLCHAPWRRPMTMTGLDKWYGYIKSHDRAELWELLHPDAVFESPVVHTPQRGRDITFKYLVSALKVLNGESFRYLGEWRSDDGAVLEFATEIDGITINGVDIIKFDGEGRITHFKVMVRPLKAINLLHRLMGEQLAAAAAG
jgi:SnoaL-like protein